MEIEVVDNITRDTFLNEVYPRRTPAILRGFDLGPCMQKWDVPYLQDQGKHCHVKIHVSQQTQMDFINKNFVYRSLPFDEFVKRASQEEHEDFFISNSEKYYLRALGDDPRKDVADISVQFPELAADIIMPPFFDEEQFFSSVFRIGSKGMQLWTHYDVMDNILLQIVGSKKVVLFAPSDADFLYMNGDKSEILDIDSPDLERFPLFSGATPYRGYLYPGDMLFIPALWFHNMTYEDFGVAVNVFWRHLDPSLYDSKDPYGNRDPVPAQRAAQIMDRAMKALEELPEDYRDFYARGLCHKIRNRLYKKV
ncbi:tRNA wybutosine-synthesizing protein 5 [Aplysia californica]|uniref:tRNA wybutosine-synthesizing protein 5 n=1 Tax=Aplysia californica TaxID=6500 RepID=A0ABM0JQY7_APLCA|nr:tRNA wybutosine-synthesizing protein 5 [Aplysia californica]